MLRPPFEGKDMEELFRNVQNKPIPHVLSYYSQELSELILLCLRKKPALRPTAKELLTHQLFQKYLQNHRSLEKEEAADKGVPAKQKLLQTIKLPNDLTKLKGKLPDSKYES